MAPYRTWLLLATLVELLTTPDVGLATDLASVAEPTTIVLVGAGAAAAGVAAWWKRRAKK